MTTRRLPGPRTYTPPRRKLVWARFSTQQAGVSAFTADLLATFRTEMGITANLPGTTITAVRGSLRFVYDASPPASEVGRLIVGMRTADIGNLPTSADHPIAEPGSDWMYISQGYYSGGNTETNWPSAARLVLEYQVRSQRKLDEINRTLWFVFATVDNVAAGDLSFRTDVLLRLP